MKVRISDLNHEGLQLNESISLEALNDRMSAAKGNDIVFTAAPQAHILVRRMEGGAEVSGDITSRYHQPCSRCAEEIDRELKVPINIILQEISTREKSLENGEESFDDIGITFFEGDHVELDEILQEQMILTLDNVYRPPCDANGKCSLCGKNPSSNLPNDNRKGAVSLGELLSAAAAKKG